MIKGHIDTDLAAGKVDIGLNLIVSGTVDDLIYDTLGVVTSVRRYLLEYVGLEASEEYLTRFSHYALPGYLRLVLGANDKAPEAADADLCT